MLYADAIREWDGTTSMVDIERCALYAVIHYPDGESHIVSHKYADKVYLFRINPNNM